MLCTHPDICNTVGFVSHFLFNCGQRHWKYVKRISRDLRGTADYKLCHQGSDLQLVSYSDTDQSGDLDERKSTFGYVFLLNNGIISCSIMKQTCMAL